MKIKDYKGDGLNFYNAVSLSGIDNEELQKLMGVSNGTFYRLYKKKEFDAEEKAAAAKALGKTVAEIFPVTPERPQVKIPLIGEAAAGGDMEININDTNHDTQYIDVGDLLRDSEAAFTVYGNSMNPNYPSGCILGIRRNYDSFIQPGEIYMLETKSNRIFKRLYYNKDKTGFVCHSDNTMKYEAGTMTGEYYYPPFDVSHDDVIRVFDVTGMIKRTRNSGIINRQK